MICGQHAKFFSGSTHGICLGLNLDGKYPHPWMKLVSLDNGDKKATFKCGKGEITLTILQDHKGEYCEFGQLGAYERLFDHPPSIFRLAPFIDNKADRVEG